MQQPLSDKIQQVFGDLAVDKRAALRPGFEALPRFVTEFLIAKARESNAAMSIEAVRERIASRMVDADRKKAIIHALMTKGEVSVIGLLDVEPDLARGEHLGHIAQLDGESILVPLTVVETHKELLAGGLWGSIKLTVDREAARPRIALAAFSPYQLTRPDISMFRRARHEFSLEEWVDLLITSVGYRPAAFPDFRLKLLLLTRLTPLTQAGVNLVELGPRGTGKSYMLRNLSARAYLVAGAKATPASLFYNLTTKQLGIVGTKKVVVFDEVTHTSFPDPGLVAALKDYMESGNIARGGRSLTADAGVVFTGNIELDVEGRLPSPSYRHLFEAFPVALRDAAIADRIHGIIPGWELPKISDHVLADGVGLLSDYFGEVLVELRREHSFNDFLEHHTKLDNATQRDKRAVFRIAAGLLRLLYPDGEIGEEGLKHVVQVAVELRQRVHRQLEQMAPGEFKPKAIAVPGMEGAVPADLVDRSSLTDQDVSANESDQLGKVSMLLVSRKGGGDVGFVECIRTPGNGLPLVTGTHGRVMSHSVKAAYEAIQHAELGAGSNALLPPGQRFGVHLVHIAEPKEGPSAGLAFALAMLSAASGRPVRRGIAVTGELSVQGNVTGVGGLYEKLAAAVRHGRTNVIIPAENTSEISTLTAFADRLKIHAVRTLAEALDIALLPAEPASHPDRFQHHPRPRNEKDVELN